MCAHRRSSDRLDEQVDRERFGRHRDLASGVEPVQADDRVVVDLPTPLELGHLHVRDPDHLGQLRAWHTGQPRQRPRDRDGGPPPQLRDRKSTRLNSSHEWISYAVFCLKKKKKKCLYLLWKKKKKKKKNNI